MGVDTGKALHAVVLRRLDAGREEVVHLAVCREFSDLDELMARFKILLCVIDGLPETHESRNFARRHLGHVYLNYFNEHQRGAAAWNHQTQIVQVNRTEALDASREAVRQRRLVLPRQTPIVAEFARHMAADAKILDEDKETGAQQYRYIKTGENHFSFAFTYAWMATSRIVEPHITWIL